MKANIQRKVLVNKTLDEKMFDRLLKAAKCDTITDLDQIGFTSTILIDESDKGYIYRYHLNFYGDQDKGYRVNVEECYCELTPSFGKTVVERYDVLAAHKKQLQDRIYKERDTIIDDIEDEKEQRLQRLIHAITSPYLDRGLTEAMFI